MQRTGATASSLPASRILRALQSGANSILWPQKIIRGSASITLDGFCGDMRMRCGSARNSSNGISIRYDYRLATVTRRDYSRLRELNGTRLIVYKIIRCFSAESCGRLKNTLCFFLLVFSFMGEPA